MRVKLSIDGDGKLSAVVVRVINARRFIKKAAPFPKPPNSKGITIHIRLTNPHYGYKRPVWKNLDSS